MMPNEPHSVVEIALKAAVLVHQSGGDAARTEATMRRVATALGVERVDTMVSSMSLSLTAKLNGATFTGMRRAPHMGVNFRVLTGMERALQSLEAGRIGMEGFEGIVARMAKPMAYYPSWLIVPSVGLACAGFAAMFLGDAVAISIAFLAGAAGMTVRLIMNRKRFKPFSAVTVSAFIAALVAGLLDQFSATPDIALASSVLFLIPGVPLINGASDMLNGSYLNAMVRFAMGLTLISGLALGMSVALRIIG